MQYDKDAMTKILKRYGSMKYACSGTQDFVTDSIRALGTLKEGEAEEVLIETIKFMAYRTT